MHFRSDRIKNPGACRCLSCSVFIYSVSFVCEVVPPAAYSCRCGSSTCSPWSRMSHLMSGCIIIRKSREQKTGCLSRKQKTGCLSTENRMLVNSGMVNHEMKVSLDDLPHCGVGDPRLFGLHSNPMCSGHPAFNASQTYVGVWHPSG